MVFGTKLFHNTFLIKMDHQKDHQLFIVIIQMGPYTKGLFWQQIIP